MTTDTPIKSPCILVCAIEPKSGHCFGCGRTREEISGWMDYSHEQRDAIMEILPARVAKLERKPRRVTKRARLRNQASKRDIMDVST